MEKSIYLYLPMFEMSKKDNEETLRQKVHESRKKMGERVVKSDKEYSRKGKNKFNFNDLEDEC